MYFTDLDAFLALCPKTQSTIILDAFPGMTENAMQRLGYVVPVDKSEADQVSTDILT